MYSCSDIFKIYNEASIISLNLYSITQWALHPLRVTVKDSKLRAFASNKLWIICLEGWTICYVAWIICLHAWTISTVSSMKYLSCSINYLLCSTNYLSRGMKYLLCGMNYLSRGMNYLLCGMQLELFLQ